MKLEKQKKKRGFRTVKRLNLKTKEIEEDFEEVGAGLSPEELGTVWNEWK